MTPEQIVAAAVENSVGVLAISDHDTIDGSLSARKVCADSGIRLIPAVEADSLDRDKKMHILAYGVDFQNAEFISFINHTRFLLDEKSTKLIDAMQHDYDNISLGDYFEYLQEKRWGGWKGLRYLADRGITSYVKEGRRFYSQYGISDAKAGYSPTSVVIYRIHKAGGYAVMAHPGKSLDTAEVASFQNEVERFVSYGLDGIECYYPEHTEVVTRACLDVCKKHDLLITSGSDCHGSFGSTRVGEMEIMMDRLRLGDLV